MRTKMMFRFAASSTALALAAVGCSPSADLRPATLASLPPKQAASASRAAAAAVAALQAHNGAEAVAQAETAVALSPSDAGYRAILAQSYLEAGRFASAEAAFHDVLALDTTNGKAMLGLALAQIAQGRQLAALGTLESGMGRIGPSDMGLALALAGDPQRAVGLLEPIARGSGATPKLRQNLALAYALAGRWDKAKATAAVDLPAEQVDARMEAWAKLSSPTHAAEQVATLLGVTPSVDPGQPERLALASAAGPSVTVPLDRAQPAPEKLAQSAAPAVLPAPVPAPTELAAATPAPVRPIPYRMPVEPAAKTYVKPQRVAATRTEPREVAPFVARKPVPQSKTGKFAVQLGAFSDPRRVEVAWNSVSTRMARLAGFTPSKGAFRSRDAMFHRLSIAGISTRADADKLCGMIRGAGGTCFVRGTAGDAPMQWARKADKPEQLASR